VAQELGADHAGDDCAGEDAGAWVYNKLVAFGAAFSEFRQKLKEAVDNG